MGTCKNNKRDSSVLNRLSSYSSAIPQEKAYLQSFIERLVKTPSSVTVRDMYIVSELTQTTPRELLEVSLSWSLDDMEMELLELGLSTRDD